MVAALSKAGKTSWLKKSRSVEQRSVAMVGDDADGGEAGQQCQIAIRCGNHHVIGHHVLHDLGRNAQLPHGALKHSAGLGIDGDASAGLCAPLRATSRMISSG